ncbi:MAG: spore germination protein [Ruminococcaceae bacterium]|nr:spore germination protein [Oscillospiraceae bacterium]
MKKLTELMTAYTNRSDAAGIDNTPWKTTPVGKNIEVNMKIVEDLFGPSKDVIRRRFTFGQKKRKAAMICVDGLIRADRVALEIMKPLMYGSFLGDEPKTLPRTMDDVQSIYMTAGESRAAETFDDLVTGVLSGDAAVLVDGIPGVLIINAKGFPQRSVEDPQTESVLRGPREGFVENMRTNTALLRRRLKTPDFIMETLTVGQKTGTLVTVAYLRSVADPSLVEEVRRRLGKIQTDGILDSGYIEQFISDGGSTLFTTVANSEKPDAVAGKILEGRVAIIVDGSPYVLTVPTFFIENFQTTEDYYIAPLYATSLRLVRLFAFFISILTLPLYVALTTFHLELIPTELLLSMSAAKGNTPFPTVVEALLMIVVFEILKEAGIRLPRPAGQAVSMVGAIIIGETAVSAGLIGAPMVIAVAITAVSAFATPAQANASMVLRVLFLLLAGTFGGLGLALGLLLLLVHLAGLRSFGVPYLSPFVPFHLPDHKDSLFRLPHRWLLTRPSDLASRNPRRQKPSS